jgi:hypothetical protein
VEERVNVVLEATPAHLILARGAFHFPSLTFRDGLLAVFTFRLASALSIASIVAFLGLPTPAPKQTAASWLTPSFFPAPYGVNSRHIVSTR